MNILKSEFNNMNDTNTIHPLDKNSFGEQDLFKAFNNAARRSWLMESLRNWIISDKEYLEEVKWLLPEERSISDFYDTKNKEKIQLKKISLQNEKIYSAIELIVKLFEWKVSKVDGTPSSNHSLWVAWILARHNELEQNIIVGILHDVIEDIENWKELLYTNWFDDKIISLVEELSEDKNLSWEERKQNYLKHLTDASNDIKIVSAADKIYNVRSFIDQYLIEQEDIWKRFNAWKEKQIQYLKDYIESLKNNFSHPIVDELERLIKRFLRMVK